MTEDEKKELLYKFPGEKELLLQERNLKERQLEQERARAYFAAQPPRGPTPRQESQAEFQRGQRALGGEVHRLSQALHLSQEVARKMKAERNAMEARMREMGQHHAATVAQLQQQIHDLKEQLERLRNPNQGGPPSGRSPYGF